MPHTDPAARAAYRANYQAQRREELAAKRRARYAARPERERETMRAYRAAHRYEAVARSRAFHAARRAEQNARRRAWHAAHRDEVNARRRAQYAKDPGPKLREVARWRQERPTLAAAVSAARFANCRADALGIHGRLTSNDVIALWQSQPACVDCGNGRGLDHVIPLSRGGANTTGNIANRCRSCNSRKGNRLPKEIAA